MTSATPQDQPDVASYADFEDIIAALPMFEEAAAAVQDTLLANLVMIGEVPSPTFDEADRVEFLRNRFTECGLEHCSIDEKSNCFGVLNGTDGSSDIVIVAHTDTHHERDVDHSIALETDRVIGAGLGDNSLGVAALATMPTLIERLSLKLRSNLILMGSARSLGRGNLEGLRFFLDNTKRPIRAGVCLEGERLGRLSYKSIGMIRSELVVSVPTEYDWTRFGASSAILTVNTLINKILEIPRPLKPRTTINFGAIHGGSSFSTSPRYVSLRFEVRSESSEQVKSLWNQIESIVAEVSSDSGAEVTLDVFAQRELGGLQFSHPLVMRTRNIMQALFIEDRGGPSTSELSGFIDAGIPAVTLGLSHGEPADKIREALWLDPMALGLAQLIGLILAIDGGFCDVD